MPGALKKILPIVVILALTGVWYKAGKPLPARLAALMSGDENAMRFQKDMWGPMPVGAVVVAAKDLSVVIEAVGTLSASETAEIRVMIAGVISKINFSEGLPVKKGDSLIEIDDSPVRAELMKAEAVYNVRKTTFERSDKLKSSGFVSSQDWEQNRSSLQEAAADVETMRIRLEKTKVRIPFDGLAGLRSFSAGDFVQIGDMLTTLDAIDPVKITFTVPEKNYGDIRPGQKISFRVDAWPKETFTGDIYAVAPRIDQNTRNFDVKAAIPNADGRLRPGMFARVNIVTATHTGALVVPEQAIIPKGDDSFVFAVRNGKAAWQKVKIGLRQTGEVEITEGLAAGEMVVVAGTMKLQDGTPVMVSKP